MTHNFKWPKISVICEVPIYISVSRLNAYFTANSPLSGVIQVLIMLIMSSAVNISALRVELIYLNFQPLEVERVKSCVQIFCVPFSTRL